MGIIGKDSILTSFGGLIPITKEMIRRGLPELINSALEEHAPRAKQSRYQHSDMIISWILASMCGSNRINQITLMREDLANVSKIKIPSHDNIGYQMKKLVAPVQTEERKMNYQVNENSYDENIPLNRLLINATKLMGGLDPSQEYTLDVDCTFIHTFCRDTTSMANKEQYGFNPMICLIDQMPVFVSMRNGNSIADFRMKESVELCLNLLHEAGIKIKTVRTDGAGYRKGYLEMLHARGIDFVTSSPVNHAFKKMNEQLENENWRKVVIETANEFKQCEIAETSYTMTHSDVPLRIISLKMPTKAKALRELNTEDRERFIQVEKKMKGLEKRKKLKSQNKSYKDGNWNILKEDRYKMITTNDWDTPAEELIHFYNQRGTAERQFSFMKNDFGWKYPPFAKMNENTVFMIIAALANNVFRSIVKLLENKVPKLKLTTRVHKFKQIFINVFAELMDGEWVYRKKEIDYREIL